MAIRLRTAYFFRFAQPLMLRCRPRATASASAPSVADGLSEPPLVVFGKVVHIAFYHDSGQVLGDNPLN